MVDYEIFELGDLVLQSGATLRSAKLAYKTYGKLSPKKDNVIVYPTWFTGQHYENEWLIGAGMALDPKKYFIIVPNMLGNGLSSSPSNMPAPYNAARFPNVTLYDNVSAQHRLVVEKFRIKQIALVVGWSMGAQQTYQWGALYPDMVTRIAPFCGSAKTSRHNYVFLEGVKAALITDEAWRNGWYEKPPVKGLRAMGVVYAGWGLSQAFYREKLDLSRMGYASLQDFLVGYWEGLFLSRDANNILSMLWSWQQGDISANPVYKSDFVKALGAIKAKALIMPGQTDLYFPPQDNENEVKHMPNAECRPIPSIWGHWAGGPGTNLDDVKFLDAALKKLLAS
jgi:homoserine O-acetyltransferase